MIEYLRMFGDEILASNSLVWSIAFVLAFTTGVILQGYLDNYLIASLATAGMFVSVMIGTTAFSRVGLMFTADENANVVAAGGVSICAVATMTIIIMMIFNAIGEARQKRRYAEEAAHQAHASQSAGH